MDWLKWKKKEETPSVIRLEKKPDGLWVVRVKGALTNAGLTAFRQRAAAELDKGVSLKVLVILDQFLGWEKGGATDDISFLMQYDSKELKIAITGEERWREPFLLWMGAGRRLSEVKYFAGAAEAETWLRA